MIFKSSVLAVAALYFLGPGINGQCIPNQVSSLTITASSVLVWEVDPEEPCQVNEFIVDIEGDWDDKYHFWVNETMANVSFLNICEEWHFVVTPVAAGVVGYERRLVDYVPLPPFADLSLSDFGVTHVPYDPTDLLVWWNLANHTYGDCTLRYRIMVEDENSGDLRDIYVTGYSTVLQDLSPCVFYQISVRAINRAHPTIEGPRRFTYHNMPTLVQVAPTVNNVEMGATTADLRFNLEPHNRCPVRTLFVESGNNFNISVPLENIEGERPPVEVNLKGLKPDSMYLLRVSVENSGGVSPPAQLAVQTLPLNPGRA